MVVEHAHGVAIAKPSDAVFEACWPNPQAVFLFDNATNHNRAKGGIDKPPVSSLSRTASTSTTCRTTQP